MDIRIDHLVVAGPDLDESCAYVEQTLGVASVPGGTHPGVGTRNALIGLAPDAYIEIIGPDPDAPAPELPRWFGIDELRAPRLATWCVRTPDLRGVLEAAGALGLDLGEVSQGGRVRTDGVRLHWSVTDPRAHRFGGVLPFVMDWLHSEHPSEGLDASCSIVRLTGCHPDAEPLGAAAATLGLPIEVRAGPAVALEAEIRTPAGLVTLR